MSFIMSVTTHNTMKVAQKAKIDVGKTWGQIAYESNCSTSYLAKILNNQEPGEEKKPGIAKALGLTIEDLWPPEGEGERQSA